MTEYRRRSRAAHPSPDPDETYAMTVYVSDTIDAGSDDQEVRFAPPPGHVHRVAASRRVRMIASRRTAAAAPAVPPCHVSSRHAPGAAAAAAPAVPRP